MWSFKGLFADVNKIIENRYGTTAIWSFCCQKHAIEHQSELENMVILQSTSVAMIRARINLVGAQPRFLFFTEYHFALKAL